MEPIDNVAWKDNAQELKELSPKWKPLVGIELQFQFFEDAEMLLDKMESLSLAKKDSRKRKRDEELQSLKLEDQTREHSQKKMRYS